MRLDEDKETRKHLIDCELNTAIKESFPGNREAFNDCLLYEKRVKILCKSTIKFSNRTTERVK